MCHGELLSNNLGDSAVHFGPVVVFVVVVGDVGENLMMSDSAEMCVCAHVWEEEHRIEKVRGNVARFEFS